MRMIQAFKKLWYWMLLAFFGGCVLGAFPGSMDDVYGAEPGFELCEGTASEVLYNNTDDEMIVSTINEGGWVISMDTYDEENDARALRFESVVKDSDGSTTKVSKYVETRRAKDGFQRVFWMSISTGSVYLKVAQRRFEEAKSWSEKLNGGCSQYYDVTNGTSKLWFYGDGTAGGILLWKIVDEEGNDFWIVSYVSGSHNAVISFAEEYSASKKAT